MGQIKKENATDADCLIAMAEVIMKALPIEVVKTATPTEVVEPGGNVEFGVTVSNESSYDSAIIELLVDNIHGNLDKDTLEAHNWTTSSCDLPQTIGPNGSYSCTFTAYVAGNAGDRETDTVTATGKDQQSNGWRNKGRGDDDDDDDYEDDDYYVRRGNEFEDSGRATVTIKEDPCNITRYTDHISRNAEWEPVECNFDEGVMTTMVIVPTGSFNGVSLAAFFVDKTEVTNAAYQVCVDDGVCTERGPNDYSTMPNQPINNAGHGQAEEYCKWRGARLPTREEWEYAARGPDSLVYPWGNTFDSAKVNSIESGIGKTTPVENYQNGASWVKALDMSGNLWEWLASRGEARGGSFRSNSDGVRTTAKIKDEALGEGETGFRCVR